MSGTNVTILDLPTMTAPIAAGDRYVLWDLSASGTYQATASQVADATFLNTATIAVAGVAALPSGPVGFVLVNINGAAFKLPYYTV